MPYVIYWAFAIKLRLIKRSNYNLTLC
ncbi:hypothetical protein CRENPOLYSF2_2150018 [Crenothrix polyspora]|uniref:Uncharacterized protein n=1 Tax=Crenothrix polyspora TaxID=360316 RepID=A0A1R4H4S8_9GAMM|nr:hypothetical protein CRENPOLYSF2_2150018 [Crenothrix polyspora]